MELCFCISVGTLKRCCFKCISLQVYNKRINPGSAGQVLRQSLLGIFSDVRAALICCLSRVQEHVLSVAPH